MLHKICVQFVKLFNFLVQFTMKYFFFIYIKRAITQDIGKLKNGMEREEEGEIQETRLKLKKKYVNYHSNPQQ